MSNFTPLYDRLLVEPLSEKEKMYGSIVLPSGVKHEAELTKGKVIATGSGFLIAEGGCRACECKVEDVIYYLDRFALTIELDGKKYHILKDNDPIGKVSPVTPVLKEVLCSK